VTRFSVCAPIYDRRAAGAPRALTRNRRRVTLWLAVRAGIDWGK
jgi:hypothetical protein